jgi:hypothetical protein
MPYSLGGIKFMGYQGQVYTHLRRAAAAWQRVDSNGVNRELKQFVRAWNKYRTGKHGRGWSLMTYQKAFGMMMNLVRGI